MLAQLELQQHEVGPVRIASHSTGYFRYVRKVFIFSLFPFSEFCINSKLVEKFLLETLHLFCIFQTVWTAIGLKWAQLIKGRQEKGTERQEKGTESKKERDREREGGRESGGSGQVVAFTNCNVSSFSNFLFRCCALRNLSYCCLALFAD